MFFGSSNAAVNRQFPPVEASHTETWVMVCRALEVHDKSAERVAMVPDNDRVAATRVVGDAGLPVPGSPGSPTCNFTYSPEGIEYDANPSP